MPWTIIVTVYWLAITHTIMSSNSLIRAASVHKWEILFHWITDHAGWLTSLHGAAPIDHDSSVFQTQAVILHLFICHTTSQEKWVMHWFAVYAWLRECKGERERPCEGHGLPWSVLKLSLRFWLAFALRGGLGMAGRGGGGWAVEALLSILRQTVWPVWWSSSVACCSLQPCNLCPSTWSAAKHTFIFSFCAMHFFFFSSNRDIILNSRGILHDFQHSQCPISMNLINAKESFLSSFF